MNKEKCKFKGKMYDEDCLPEESIDTHLNKLFDIIGQLHLKAQESCVKNHIVL